MTKRKTKTKSKVQKPDERVKILTQINNFMNKMKKQHGDEGVYIEYMVVTACMDHILVNKGEKDFELFMSGCFEAVEDLQTYRISQRKSSKRKAT